MLNCLKTLEVKSTTIDFCSRLGFLFSSTHALLKLDHFSTSPFRFKVVKIRILPNIRVLWCGSSIVRSYLLLKKIKKKWNQKSMYTDFTPIWIIWVIQARSYDLGCDFDKHGVCIPMTFKQQISKKRKEKSSILVHAMQSWISCLALSVKCKPNTYISLLTRNSLPKWLLRQHKFKEELLNFTVCFSTLACPEFLVCFLGQQCGDNHNNENLLNFVKLISLYIHIKWYAILYILLNWLKATLEIKRERFPLPLLLFVFFFFFWVVLWNHLLVLLS